MYEAAEAWSSAVGFLTLACSAFSTGSLLSTPWSIYQNLKASRASAFELSKSDSLLFVVDCSVSSRVCAVALSRTKSKYLENLAVCSSNREMESSCASVGSTPYNVVNEEKPLRTFENLQGIGCSIPGKRILQISFHFSVSVLPLIPDRLNPLLPLMSFHCLSVMPSLTSGKFSSHAWRRCCSEAWNRSSGVPLKTSEHLGHCRYRWTRSMCSL